MNSNFPRGHTAFLIIHGIGDQQPFDTLDQFTRGIVDYLEPHVGHLQIEHKTSFYRGQESGSAWMKSFVRIKPKAEQDGDHWIDIHEFYWAYLTEGKISMDQVLQWLKQTIRGAIKTYEVNKEFLDANFSSLKKENNQKNRPYWWRLNTILRRVYWLYPIARLLEWLLLRWIPAAIPLPQRLRQAGLRVIVDFIGDVAIYTSLDQKSRHYDVRQRILGESQAFLEEMLEREEYDQVVVAGHSLGSVIAYDTLNRMNTKANDSLNKATEAYIRQIQKIRGLITFGSPLDKILFYFRPHSGDQQYVRKQLLTNLHAFKRNKQTNELQALDSLKTGLEQNPIQQFFDHLWWINFYDEEDPISGCLNFYEIEKDNNVKLKLGKSWGVAHNYYWGCNVFYERIFKMLLTQNPSS
ncbi:MAG: hypothetical protein HC769_22165 [Cyanobacteria bacterium CRU_2_1]|nr:hypothetical protein [Cyanobacteria bacterium CRU_2_1]